MADGKYKPSAKRGASPTTGSSSTVRAGKETKFTPPKRGKK